MEKFLGSVVLECACCHRLVGPDAIDTKDPWGDAARVCSAESCRLRGEIDSCFDCWKAYVTGDFERPLELDDEETLMGARPAHGLMARASRSFNLFDEASDAAPEERAATIIAARDGTDAPSPGYLVLAPESGQPRFARTGRSTWEDGMNDHDASKKPVSE